MQEISLKCAISWEIEGSICYNETCLRKFWGDKGDMDALNVLNRCSLVEIPLEGKEYREEIALWLVLRPEVIPEPTLRHLIDDFEKHVLHFRGLSEKTPAWRAASDCRCIVWVGIGANRINADGFSISDFFDNTQENAAEAAEALWQIEHIKDVLGGQCDPDHRKEGV